MTSKPSGRHLRTAGATLLLLALGACQGFRDFSNQSRSYSDSYDRYRLSSMCTWELNGDSMRKCAAGLAGQGE